MSSVEFRIRDDLKPGDMGYLIYLHGILYAKEFRYNHEFEGYVAQTFYEFSTLYHPSKDRLFLAESQDKILGSIAILGRTDNLCQLRWFLVHPDARGRGLGRTLLNKALTFAQEQGYQKVHLSTTQDQTLASAIYQKAGFALVEEKPVRMWGFDLVEQRYELVL